MAKRKKADKKKERGRPTKCTLDLIEKAESLMAEGHYAVTIARHLRIGESTWYDWLTWADDPEKDEIYSEFSEAVARGEAEAEMKAVRNIQRAALDPEEWRANVEYLKRRFRDRWSERTELTGADGRPVEMSVTEVVIEHEEDG